MHTTPRYTHDCDQCRFLGQIDQYDLYFCERADEGSAIARYGNDGPEYASRGFMTQAIAEQRARTGGLNQDQAIVLAMFTTMPSLLLNIWKH